MAKSPAELQAALGQVITANQNGDVAAIKAIYESLSGAERDWLAAQIKKQKQTDAEDRQISAQEDAIQQQGQAQLTYGLPATIAASVGGAYLANELGLTKGSALEKLVENYLTQEAAKQTAGQAGGQIAGEVAGQVGAQAASQAGTEAASYALPTFQEQIASQLGTEIAPQVAPQVGAEAAAASQAPAAVSPTFLGMSPLQFASAWLGAGALGANLTRGRHKPVNQQLAEQLTGQLSSAKLTPGTGTPDAKQKDVANAIAAIIAGQKYGGTNVFDMPGRGPQSEDGALTRAYRNAPSRFTNMYQNMARDPIASILASGTSKDQVLSGLGYNQQSATDKLRELEKLKRNSAGQTSSYLTNLGFA